MDRWLTPNTPASGFICRRLLIPNGIDWLAIVAGCLNSLIYPSNFEDFGSSTAQQTADAFAVMFDKFSFDQGEECRLIGEIVTYAGPTSPSANFLLCDGTSYLRTDFPDLFAVIGTTYGAIDGNHFSVPDLRGRVVVDVGTGPGLSTYNLADIGGEETHVLTTPELASHSHIDSGHAHTEGSTVPTAILVGVGAPAPAALGSISVTGTGNAALSSTGSDGPHNNLQPYIALFQFIVAA